MRQIARLTFALLFSSVALGSGAAIANDSKHKQEEAAKHAAEKAEHERKKQEEAAKHAAEKAEHERKKQEEAAKHAAEKAEHQKKLADEKAGHEMKRQEEAARKAEHERKKQEEPVKNAASEKTLKAESEARIAASKKARAAKQVQKSRQTERDRQIAGTLSKVAVTLHQADHDYDWQRHEAVELVRGALHDLHEQEPNTSGKFGGMTQKKSDQLLRENIPILESMRSELAASGAPANHHEARVKIEEALSNLHAALKIR